MQFETIKSFWNRDNYFFLWCILFYKYKVDNHGERVTHYTKRFHEHNQGDIHFPMKANRIPTFEQLNILNENFSELSSSFNADYVSNAGYTKNRSPKKGNENYFEEQIYLLLYENHSWLETILNKFCRSNEDFKNVCRRCLNIHGDRTKVEKHMLRCAEHQYCNVSYMHPNQKMNLNEWYMKRDPPMWTAADSDCMNVSLKSTNQKLFLSKPIAIGYIIVEDPYYDNLKLEENKIQWIF